VVGGFASVFALVVGWMPKGKFDLEQASLLSTSSIVTASLASFFLGLIMIGVIIGN
jgi:solute carrier family 41